MPPMSEYLLSGCPSRQHDAVDSQRCHPKEEQQAHIRVGNDDRAGERDDRKRDEYRYDDDRRREDEDQLVGEGRYPVLLHEQLDDVRNRLQQSQRARRDWGRCGPGSPREAAARPISWPSSTSTTPRSHLCRFRLPSRRSCFRQPRYDWCNDADGAIHVCRHRRDIHGK